MGRHSKRVISYKPRVKRGYTPRPDIIENAADAILDLMGIKFGDMSLDSIIDMGYRLGGNLYYDESAKWFGGGYHERQDNGDSEIVIDRGLKPAARSTVLVHELAHRLCYSDFMEQFNEGYMTMYDPREFREAVARSVESRFVAMGGFNVRKDAIA